MPVNGTTYNSRRIPFNLSVSEDVTLKYIDNSVANSRWRRLCNNCDGYGNEKRKRTRSFKKGVHKILVMAIDKAGNSDVKNIVFEVDY
jgi:hypothetical protein